MRMRIKRPLALHPFLLAAFPVLFLYAHNIRYAVSFRDVVWPLLYILAGTAVVMLVVWLAFRRDAYRAGLVASALVILFFTYGQLYLALGDTRIAGVRLGRNLILLPVWGLLLAASVVLAIKLTRARLITVTKGLNTVAAILVLTNVATAAWYRVQSGGEEASEKLHFDTPASTLPKAAAGARDIYYIVLEEYAGQRTFQELFGFDNRPFLNFLRTQGFYVADRSTTNYPSTSMSLSSSLNMRYLDGVGAAAKGDDWGPVYQMLRNENEVGSYLKARGYRYVHMGSWWHPTAINRSADLNVRFRRSASEFSSTLLETTLLQPISQDLPRSLQTILNHRLGIALRTLWAFEEIPKIKELPGPKFVFAHIISPHYPYVLDRSGRYQKPEEEATRTEAQNYLEQVMFVNKRIIDTVKVLLQGPASQRPIVIIQSDEGPYKPADHAPATPQEVLRKYEILNAYYLPGVDLSQSGLYPSITPVNTFRLLFDVAFHDHLPLLPDRNYSYPDQDHLYDFIDQTAEVKAQA
jgi:Sulfatase